MSNHSDLYRNQGIKPVPMDVLDSKLALYDDLTQWEHAVQRLSRSIIHPHDHDKVRLMRIHSRTGLTLLESSLHNEECLFDTYQWAFEDIINYTAELQDGNYHHHSDAESSSESETSTTPEPSRSSKTPNLTPSPASKTGSAKRRSPRPFFILDNGVIFSLYWAALKCRDGYLRRRAIALLERSTQEGVWIGPIQAAIAKRVIEIEEGRPYEQDPPSERVVQAEDVPEHIRVHNVGSDLDKGLRRARIVLLQKLDGPDGDWHESVEYVGW